MGTFSAIATNQQPAFSGGWTVGSKVIAAAFFGVREAWRDTQEFRFWYVLHGSEKSN